MQQKLMIWTTEYYRVKKGLSIQTSPFLIYSSSWTYEGRIAVGSAIMFNNPSINNSHTGE